MDIHNEFIAQEKNLVFYKGKPIINRIHDFYDLAGNSWDFSDAIGYFMNIYEEREGGIQVIEWTDTAGNLSNSGNFIYLNAPSSDSANLELGKYYYELGYLVAGGYEVLLGYGQAKFI
jgi:hypothetical protein